MHFKIQIEVTSWYKTYWEQKASIPSVAAFSGKTGKKLCSSWAPFSVLIFYLLPSSEYQTNDKYYIQNINIQTEFSRNRSCSKQGAISSDRKMYLEGWCRQIDVHYHTYVSTCAYPAVSIPSSFNGFRTLTSKNSQRSENNLTLLCRM